jgi:hypothetical protein
MDNACPDPEHFRPPLQVLYQYAGFFINTIGGRAYLFRRSPRFRLVMSYYCVLIIYEADKRGLNSYGIDLVPFIEPLRKEITHYPDFEFQEEYLYRLRRIQEDYLQKRSTPPRG